MFIISQRTWAMQAMDSIGVRTRRSLLLIALTTAGAHGASDKAALSTGPAGQQTSVSVQKLWCRQVRSGLEGARGLEPAMRSYVLDAAASGLSRCAPKQVRAALTDAFTATLGIVDTEVKQQLQTAALKKLLAIDVGKVESLMAKAEPPVRAALLETMIENATTAKNFDRAMSLLRDAPSDEGFPYGAATNLILAMSASRDGDKQEVFRLAMASDHEAPSMAIGGEDFGSMIVRFWRHVPPNVAVAAIHQVVDEAKSGHSQINLKSRPREASFDTAYEYRAFELLPILKQLDNTEADRLGSELPTAQTQLRTFPEGVQSLDPTLRDTSPKRAEKLTPLGGTAGPQDTVRPMLQEEALAEAYESQIIRITHLALDDPKQALASAATLPISAGSVAPRLQALAGIAETTMQKQPSAARHALEEMLQALKALDVKEVERHFSHTAYWTKGIDIAIEIGSPDLAKDMLGDGVEFAQKLEKEDGNNDDPNTALKAWWPSTVLMSRLILAGLRISPESALQALNDISDPTLKLVSQITVANGALGVPTVASIVMVKKKEAAWAQFGAPET